MKSILDEVRSAAVSSRIVSMSRLLVEAQLEGQAVNALVARGLFRRYSQSEHLLTAEKLRDGVPYAEVGLRARYRVEVFLRPDWRSWTRVWHDDSVIAQSPRYFEGDPTGRSVQRAATEYAIAYARQRGEWLTLADIEIRETMLSMEATARPQPQITVGLLRRRSAQRPS